MAEFVIGIDLGTASARALLVGCGDGAVLGAGSAAYPSGREGVLELAGEPAVARQNPADYQAAVVAAVRLALAQAPKGAAEQVVGIGLDATASTPVPVDASLTPLAMTQAFSNRLDAQAWLWKDHSAQAEADEITSRLQECSPYLARVGGRYSCEWWWAKILACARRAPDVFASAATWVEASDYVPAWLVGLDRASALPRNITAAGHKGLFSSEWGGWPDGATLGGLHPGLAKVVESLDGPVLAPGSLLGRLARERAEDLGVPAGVAVAIGGVDAHVGAVGAGVRPGRLVKVLGTSGCDITVGPYGASLPAISGLSGVVAHSVLPGCDGLEAGQAAVGDLLAWAVRLTGQTHQQLELAAAAAPAAASGLLALDWHNGNRCVLQNSGLTGLMLGQTLHTSPAEVYRAQVEAIAFGARVILEQIEAGGAGVSELTLCGGVAEKSALLRQVLADVLERPLQLAGSQETCALGAAVLGAVAAGAHRSISEAQEAMLPAPRLEVAPRPEFRPRYRELYALYLRAHDAFGRPGATDLSDVMRRLSDLRTQALTGAEHD